MSIWQSQQKKKIRRKSSKGVGRNKTNKPWLLASTPKPQKRKRRSVTPVSSRVSFAIRKAIILANAQSQKTSVGLGNFCANN